MSLFKSLKSEFCQDLRAASGRGKEILDFLFICIRGFVKCACNDCDYSQFCQIVSSRASRWSSITLAQHYHRNRSCGTSLSLEFLGITNIFKCYNDKFDDRFLTNRVYHRPQFLNQICRNQT